MTVDLWPCHRCGAPGVKNLGARGWCGRHLAGLYARFDPAVFRLNGVGLPAGVNRPEYGPDACELRCVACDASWVGDPCDPCVWCAKARVVLAEAQAVLALQPPDVAPEDRAYDGAMCAWAERLANAVKAGIVTETEARRALARVEGGARDRAA